MTEITPLSQLLLPELEHEFEKTRKLIHALPEAQLDYKPHQKSFSLSRLAGHTAELPRLISLFLTQPDTDISTGFQPLFFTTRATLLADFDHAADQAITDIKLTSDETFHQPWKLLYKNHTIFSGSRYQAYREMGVNHMIHHRGQLGVYLRLLDAPVPGTYGPSADEPFTA